MPVLSLECLIPASGVELPGILAIPPKASSIVLFAHGSGSGRRSPRNQSVARALQSAGLATLLLDLLTEAEAEDRRLVFDLPLLASRLESAVVWVRGEPACRGFSIGLFGASTGAGAALMLAARDPRIAAVVSRGGRPDLALGELPKVMAPTLLLVGSLDVPVIAMNQEAFAAMNCAKDLRIIPGASHLFEEPGTLDQVASYAAGWFLEHLGEHRVP